MSDWKESRRQRWNRRKAKGQGDYNHGKNGLVSGNPRNAEERSTEDNRWRLKDANLNDTGFDR